MMKLIEINKLSGVVASILMDKDGNIIESTMMKNIDSSALSQTVEKLYNRILKYARNMNGSARINEILIDSKGQGKIFIANLRDESIIAVVAEADVNIGMLKIEIQSL